MKAAGGWRWSPLGRRRRVATVLAVLALAGAFLARGPREPSPDVPWVATPPEVVQAMLTLADVEPGDVVYDLGSGDGRVVLAAARDFGARAVGIEIDSELVGRARARVDGAGLADRVEIRRGDLFATDLRPASVVTLYLLPTVNLELRPALLRGLSAGSRVVSHRWDMGRWQADAETAVRTPRGPTARVLLWVVPAAAGGTWDLEPTSAGAGGRRWTLRLWQRFQEIEARLRPAPGQRRVDAATAGTADAGAATGRSGPVGPEGDLVATGRLEGRRLELDFRARSSRRGSSLRAVVRGDRDRLTGTLEFPDAGELVEVVGRRRPWSLAGTWEWLDPEGPVRLVLVREDGVLRARLGRPEAAGAMAGDGAGPAAVSVFQAWGASLYLQLAGADPGVGPGDATFLGLAEGDRLVGTRRGHDLTVRPWEARRLGAAGTRVESGEGAGAAAAGRG